MILEATRADALKAHQEARFAEIFLRHRQGVLAHQVIASLTALADEIIESLYGNVLLATPPPLRWKLKEGLAIVALGGYGRGELSPYSDIDLMFLYQEPYQELAEEASKKILRALWDTGYRVGHSLRTLQDCTRLAQSDFTTRTSLLEARIVTGARSLFEKFYSHFHQKLILRNGRDYIAAKIRERAAEEEKYGTTVYLLEPHVKLSRGGLRDLHLFLWLTLCLHHTSSLETLKDLGILSKADYQALTQAQEFLWQIRNELHFFARQCQDRLTFDEQVRLASLYQFKDEGHLLAVEQFMKQYYEKTTVLVDITLPIIEQVRPKSFLFQVKQYVRRKRLEDRFLMTGDTISILPEAREKIFPFLSELLRLFHLAQLYNLKLSTETRDLIKEATPSLSSSCGEEAIFLKILGAPGQVGRILREMHRLRLLERIVPAFAKARALMQFNAYHKYTVDEHSFRAVEEAEHLLQVAGRAGQVYREIHRKDILHLSLLLHDIGKGEGADHCALGAQIAEEVSHRLELDADAKKLLTFLVREHLLMTHLAFRRDLADTHLLIQFAKTVATPEALKMLYILTLSDVAAVGAGTLTDWKKDLLEELFEKTLEMLTGEHHVVAEEAKVLAVQEWIVSHAESMDMDIKWVKEQVSFMTTRYLLTTSRERILWHLADIWQMGSEKVRVKVEYNSARKLTEYTIYTFDNLTEAIFSKISGVLAATGLQIVEASIMTWENQVVIDTFQVEDLDYAGRPPKERLEKVSHLISEVLLGHLHVETLLAHRRRRDLCIVPRKTPTKVEIDHLSSDLFTIIDLFAEDRPGLLYCIARVLFEAGLSVHTAKISTQLDQVVDVFYVTLRGERGGGKVVDPSDVARIQERLTQAVDRFLTASSS